MTASPTVIIGSKCAVAGSDHVVASGLLLGAIPRRATSWPTAFVADGIGRICAVALTDFDVASGLLLGTRLGRSQQAAAWVSGLVAVRVRIPSAIVGVVAGGNGDGTWNVVVKAAIGLSLFVAGVVHTVQAVVGLWVARGLLGRTVRRVVFKAARRFSVFPASVVEAIGTIVTNYLLGKKDEAQREW